MKIKIKSIKVTALNNNIQVKVVSKKNVKLALK